MSQRGSSYKHFKEEYFLLHYVSFLIIWETYVKEELEVQNIYWEKDYEG